MEIKNRITEIRKVRLGDIIHNPRNWRSHPDLQRKAFRATLEEIGWAGVPLAYNSERTGGLTFVDGHMRKEENPDLIVEVAITDLDDGEADNLLARYDVLPDMAEPIPDLTLDLLGSVGTECEALGDVWSGMIDEMSLLLSGGMDAIDYTDLDEQLADMEGYEEVDIRVTVPAMHKENVTEWLANGEPQTAPGMGKGILRRCGLL